MNKKCNFSLMAVATCAIGTFATADVIMDQIGSDDGSWMTGGISGSQDFDAYGVYDIVAIDDFSIGSSMNLTSASMVLAGWNGYAGTAGVMGYTVSIFSSVEAAGNSIYGDVISMYFDTTSVSGSWAGLGDLITFDLGGIELGAGSYWIGITPFNAFGDNGQTGVATSFEGDGVSAQANPAGAFGFGPYQMTDANYAYSLEGSIAAVPAPGALALLGLAGLASRRRRS
jgi:MYXO-CTERM domain-containing protein